jgi:hypothetical protein
MESRSRESAEIKSLSMIPNLTNFICQILAKHLIYPSILLASTSLLAEV